MHLLSYKFQKVISGEAIDQLLTFQAPQQPKKEMMTTMAEMPMKMYVDVL